MRTIAAIVLFVAAGISTASAQQASAPQASAPPESWSAMDHGRAAEAAAAKAAADAANARATAVDAAGPSQPADFSVNGDSVIPAAPPLTPEQQKAVAEARAAWQARCRPTVIEDREGLRRTKYAEPDCDLSAFNTAGK